MSNRYPLILDSSNNKIKELPSGDNLDLTGAGISSVGSISVGAAVTINGTGADITGVVTATNFVGDGSGITGIANTAFIVSTAATFSSEVSVGTAVTIGSYGVHATGIVTATGFVGIVTGNVTGNADSATTLETARNIGGVSFDGTGDINLPGVNESGNQNTSGTAAGLSGSPTITVAKVNVGTAATIHPTGGITAGIVTATSFVGPLTGNVTGNASGSSGSCTGNAATATILATARNIGGVSFDGSAAINLPGVNATGTQDTSGNAATATLATNAQGLSGTPDIAIGDLTASGNVSIAGTLTYQDVTNMDVLGIGTFQQGIQILANGVNVTGFSTFKTGVNITGVCTATDFNSTSDTSVKKNIQVIEDPLASIVRIEGVTFTWKDTGKNSAGVIAQNLEKVLPNLVSNGDLKSVNYNGLIGYLIEAVKSQQAQIDELKSRLDSLDS